MSVAGVMRFADPETEPFFEGAAAGRLMLRVCLDCGHKFFYARPVCRACLSQRLDWEAADPVGRIYSVTVASISLGEPFRDLLPLQVAIVQLDAGPTMLVRRSAAQRQADLPRIGQRAIIEFEPFEGRFVPTFGIEETIT